MKDTNLDGQGVNINNFLFPKTRQLNLRNAFSDYDYGSLHGPTPTTMVRAYSAMITPIAENLNAGVLSDARNRVAF